MNFILVLLAKSVNKLSRFFNLGAGGTWPGEIALKVKPSILKELAGKVEKIIVVAGTNGKTTTAKMIRAILEESGEKAIVNESGANLLNGLASSLLLAADWKGQITAKYAIFEVDENALPLLLKEATPAIIVLLNLFRDQLDRYGEVDTIAEKWKITLKDLPSSSALVLNADDPQIAGLGKNLKNKVLYFGLNKPEKFLAGPEHATDSTFCSSCGSRLNYVGIYFSHLGIWSCPKCQNKRPVPDLEGWPSPLPGLYNEYNTLAAILAVKSLGITKNIIDKALSKFTPAFGRQEEIKLGDKKIKIFLSKNPAGFNASLRAVLDFKPKAALLALNDRIPDGRDISWIWDVDFEIIARDADFLIFTGDRVYDIALRLKYADFDMEKAQINADPDEAIKNGLAKIKKGETLYVLPTYSAMLEIRKILSGKKIL